ncbi:MAG TPA: BamA/TamA family outer membrane protein [Allosphingosinicella sp.]
MAQAQGKEEVEPAGPIIPDDQFEAQLPALDPALGEPLEPIETFEGPPAAEGDPAEPVPDASIPDPALTEPLPPLSTFDVRTPEATVETDDAEPAPVRYSVVVEGLDEIGLEDEFRDLSALEEADGEAANGAMIAARAREDEALAIRLLRSEGYYDGTALAVVEQVPEQPGQLRVVLTAAPGQRYDFGAIDVTGPATVPPDLPRSELPLKSGDPIVAATVEGAEASLMLRLPEQGYPFVDIGPRDILLDPATGLGDYTLPVDPGPRARFGGYRTEGDLAFDVEHVGVIARFERGELYDSRMVDDLREAMVATNLFSSVSAEPVLTGETAPDGTEYIDILVRQDAGPPRSLTATAGFSTGQGFRLEGAWEHRNLFPPEGALRLAGVLGTKEQSIGATFRRSNAGKRDRTVLLTLEAGRRDYPAFEGYTALLSGRIARESTPIWQKRWTWAYGAELIATNETRFRRRDFDQPSDTYFIGGLVGQLGYDTSDDLLNPTSGFRLLGRVNPEASLRVGVTPYIRNLIEGSAYYPVSEDLVIAGRARFGSIYGIDRADLAPSRRFYAGGGGSVRGFGYQELGPKDAENNPIGGRSLTEFALEGRYRFGNYGAVAFIDAGQVYESQFPRLSDLRFGVGIGGRLYTNFGPLRVDIATPIDRQPGESRISLYVSIGQAF